MASSSKSEFKYDVFLSFRGLDTPKKFIDHLCEALTLEGFKTFRDLDEIQRGENMKSVLREAIRNSRMSIIVLSENYAKSTGCLFEVQIILEQSKKSDHFLLPVFYEVDRQKIKEQAKNLDFGKKEVKVEKVKGWSAALMEVASFDGMVSQNQSDRYDAKLIKDIVGFLKSRLPGKRKLELNKSMRNLKRKVYLSCQKDDVNAEIGNAVSLHWNRPKNEVEIWLREVQQLKDGVQRLEQQIIGERNVFSRALLEKLIIEIIQKVRELREKGKAFTDLLVDDFPTGRLLMPPTKDFVESTEAQVLGFRSLIDLKSREGIYLERLHSPEVEVLHSSQEELLEDISFEECGEAPSDPRELIDLKFDLMEVPLTPSYQETPSDPQKLIDLKSDLMEVPPTLSHHFSILRVLDLSHTEIKSLPSSISRLVALQKLILRNCVLLMEIPPEIGELTNLEVLDLEGTEILCLPKKIAKLVNLTCLKVSFDGYANQTVIPRGVLSSLSRLNELIIDVTPYGGWWDVEVEAIIDDLCTLKELRTLKLYFPTAELLEHLTLIFPDLANFRFTVGRHKEHFISRLPHDIEEEFNNREKLEKGLKYVNGNCIPNGITKVFKHANAFFLQCHWTAETLSEFGHENMNHVKFCLVMDCNEIRSVVDSEQLYQGTDGRSESDDFQDFDATIVLGSLEKLIIRYMKNMESIWKGPVGKGSLSNLKSLALHTCPTLTTLFTIDMLSNLINLEELIVEDCRKINSLVSLKSSDSKSGLFLARLKKISLLELPELASISSGLWIAPKLEKMVIFYCPKLEKLSTTEVSSTYLKVIKGEKEWWDALKWYESDVSTEHEDYLARLFIPLRRDGDLMAQITND